MHNLVIRTLLNVVVDVQRQAVKRSRDFESSAKGQDG